MKRKERKKKCAKIWNWLDALVKPLIPALAGIGMYYWYIAWEFPANTTIKIFLATYATSIATLLMYNRNARRKEWG